MLTNPDFQAQQEAEAERYQLLSDAIAECCAKGVSYKTLHILAMESCFNAKDLLLIMQADVKRMQADVKRIKEKLEALQ